MVQLREISVARGRVSGEEVEGAGGTGGDGESEQRTEEGEGEDFSKELADDGVVRGAEGEADGDFVLAVGSAG